VKLPRFVPRIEQTLLLVLVPILAIAALSLSSRAHSTVPPIRAAAAVARTKLTPVTTTTVAPGPAGGAALPTPSTPVAEVLSDGDSRSSGSSSSSARSRTAPPSGAPAAVVAATALPGEQPAPTISESQNPIFLVLVALMVIAIAGLLWWRAARRRERTGVTP
jgi:hypothetical protein